MKEIKADTNKREYIPYSWIGIINIVKGPQYPKLFTDLRQTHLNS
jgi:hypothetical protein